MNIQTQWKCLFLIILAFPATTTRASVWKIMNQSRCGLLRTGILTGTSTFMGQFRKLLDEEGFTPIVDGKEVAKDLGLPSLTSLFEIGGIRKRKNYSDLIWYLGDLNSKMRGLALRIRIFPGTDVVQLDVYGTWDQYTEKKRFLNELCPSAGWNMRRAILSGRDSLNELLQKMAASLNTP